MNDDWLAQYPLALDLAMIPNAAYSGVIGLDGQLLDDEEQIYDGAKWMGVAS